MNKAIFPLNLSSSLIALVLVASLSACAPGAWNEQTPLDRFFDTIENACTQRIGDFEISTLENHNAYFLDITSQLYYGKMTPDRYRFLVTSFSDSQAETNQAIDCIIAHLPKAPPPPPSLLPDMKAPDAPAAPPPPGMQ